MGRVFEKRKHKMFARFAKMAKGFTRIGKDITIAVKAGGPDPHHNAKLRAVIQNAKSINMPKDRIDAAIKRAVSKDMRNYEEVVYEGYGPHGVAILIETATDNPTRTVANLRMHFSRGEGNLATSGSVSFMFERKGLFKFPVGNLKVEELELELIDFGAQEVFEDEGFIYVYCSFEEFGAMQKALEDKKIEVTTSELTRTLANYVEDLTEEQMEKVQSLIDRFDDDDDVQNVYHNMR